MAQLTSILDNDFYKFTMQYAVVKLFPKAKARYQFINRGQHKYPPGFDQKLREAIDAMAKLKLTKAEKTFLRKTVPTSIQLILTFYKAIGMILKRSPLSRMVMI